MPPCLTSPASLFVWLWQAYGTCFPLPPALTPLLLLHMRTSRRLMREAQEREERSGHVPLALVRQMHETMMVRGGAGRVECDCLRHRSEADWIWG